MQDVHNGGYDGDEDGLGYYADGVKRTLTDEQIAMFRHSEIYALLRKRQVQKENDDADADVGAEGNSPAAAETHNGQEEELVENGDDDEEEYIAFLEQEQKDIAAAAAQNKRKRSIDDTLSQNHTRAPTLRRDVRELDSAMTTDELLDYGNDTSTNVEAPKESSKNEPVDPYGRKRIVYDQETNDPPSATPPAVEVTKTTPVEGRKIWWPTIGS